MTLTPSQTYTALWRVIAGAVLDVQQTHPDYFSGRKADSVRASITKRAVGQIIALQGCQQAGPGDRLKEGGPPSCMAPSGMALPTRRAKGRGCDVSRPILLAWPPSALDAKGRQALHRLLRLRKSRFVGFHRGKAELVFVAVRRIE